MTTADVLAHLADTGLAPDEVAAKVRPVDMAIRAFRAQTGSALPIFVCWAPGRLELLGTHTDYAGGRAIVGALPRGFVFLSAPAMGLEVRITDAGDGTRVVARSGHGPAWSRYVSVVVERLVRNFRLVPPGADVVFISDLPRAAGMSSSSALLTGLTMSLAQAWFLEGKAQWLANIGNRADLAQYCASIENGSTFGTLDGHRGVGTLGGCEDHAAILLAKAGHLSALGFAPLRHLTDARLPDGWRVVVATSGVAASKSGAVRDDYNRLSRGAARLLELWNQVEPQCASLGEALESRPEAGGRLREIVRREATTEWPADDLERRLAHFEIEDALVPDAVRAIECADRAAMGAISEASQERAEVLLGNQVPETMALARLARAQGAFAARSFGAGFGGSVWALVDGDQARGFADRWLAAYREACPAAGASAAAFVAPPGSGLVLRQSAPSGL